MFNPDVFCAFCISRTFYLCYSCVSVVFPVVCCVCFFKQLCITVSCIKRLTEAASVCGHSSLSWRSVDGISLFSALYSSFYFIKTFPVPILYAIIRYALICFLRDWHCHISYDISRVYYSQTMKIDLYIIVNNNRSIFWFHSHGVHCLFFD